MNCSSGGTRSGGAFAARTSGPRRGAVGLLGAGAVVQARARDAEADPGEVAVARGGGRGGRLVELGGAALVAGGELGGGPGQQGRGLARIEAEREREAAAGLAGLLREQGDARAGGGEQGGADRVTVAADRRVGGQAIEAELGGEGEALRDPGGQREVVAQRDRERVRVVGREGQCGLKARAGALAALLLAAGLEGRDVEEREADPGRGRGLGGEQVAAALGDALREGQRGQLVGPARPRVAAQQGRVDRERGGAGAAAQQRVDAGERGVAVLGDRCVGAGVGRGGDGHGGADRLRRGGRDRAGAGEPEGQGEGEACPMRRGTGGWPRGQAR